ncbi:hypothetical protein BSK56_11745 [Paenibacillus borealis]|uniref:Uncharacterized protein n=1 Tax=Paenibacillus borealis TaxID=160799 RepID=A0ABX3HGD3_PAEBO|nr:hypothetical protein BSK56_11745 [Paenibacillus borealis]
MSVVNIVFNTNRGTNYIEPQYDSSVIPSLILLAIVLCYLLFIIHSIKNNNQNLMIICFIISIVFFLVAPLVLGWISNVDDYFHKVSIESNDKFINKIQADINNQHIPYLIDSQTSEERVKELKTYYVVVLVKQSEGAITKDEVEFFVDVAKSKKFKKVSLLFYDLSKANYIKIFVHYEKGITYCYPNDECDEMEITENEWPVVISKTAAPSDSFRLAVVWL